MKMLGSKDGTVARARMSPLLGSTTTAAARPIARCGYLADYAEVAALFQMVRPKL